MNPDGGAEARGRPAQGDGIGTAQMLESATTRLAKMSLSQVHRDPWPDFSTFDTSAYPAKQRRHAAAQWAARARAEHGSIHQFSAVTHVLSEARAPLTMLGALARLQTDEVRHAELCAAMAVACYPEGLADGDELFSWPLPRAPWSDAPRPRDATRTELFAWAAEAVLIACCLGETLSRPMLDALAVVTTDPHGEAICRQILRDEHLHAAFGWETLGWLVERIEDEHRSALQESLRKAFAAFERTTCQGVTIEDVAETELVIERGSESNLGTMSDVVYATIFFATIEQEIFPKLGDLGFDPADAWARRS